MREPWTEIEEAARRRERLTLLAGGLLALVLLAGFRYFGDRSGATEDQVAEPKIEVPQVIPSTMGEIRVPAVAEAPAGAASSSSGRASSVGVYECEVNGQRVVSDRPCGPQAQARTIVIDQPDPREVARQQQRTFAAQAGASPTIEAPARRSVQTTGTTGTVLSNEGACRAIDDAIANLNARMRQGYTSAQGEWYRTEWHRLQKAREDYDCGRRR
jgi:hypothetical protein